MKIKEISPEKVNHILLKRERVILLDVRTKEEFDEFRIKAAINIPLDSLREKVEKIIGDKDKSIIVYCLHGHRSVTATQELMRMGYKKVLNLTDGITALGEKYKVDYDQL